MGKSNLILADSLFVIVLTIIYYTGSLKDNSIILAPLIIMAFATCVLRHINYYKLNKKIY